MTTWDNNIKRLCYKVTQSLEPDRVLRKGYDCRLSWCVNCCVCLLHVLSEWVKLAPLLFTALPPSDSLQKYCRNSSLSINVDNATQGFDEVITTLLLESCNFTILQISFRALATEAWTHSCQLDPSSESWSLGVGSIALALHKREQNLRSLQHGSSYPRPGQLVQAWWDWHWQLDVQALLPSLRSALYDRSHRGYRHSILWRPHQVYDTIIALS